MSLHYGTFSADVASIHGDGSIDGSGYGAGGTLTWYADNGFYVDGQAQVTWFDSDLESSTAGLVLEDGNEGVGYALSLEQASGLR
nr:autotransporter outer membrane beta-barrel domain-containing protein [Chelativorans sp.]